MLKYLCPNLFVRKVEDIDLKKLKEKNFDTLLLDLDNTLVGWRSTKFSPAVLEWLKLAHFLGFKMCILSNCIIKNRVKKLSETLGLPSIFKAVKPRKKSFLRALKNLGSLKEKTIVIGDQIFTDIFGGNRLGVYTILVLPLDKREFFTTIIQRTAEKIVLFSLKRKGMLKISGSLK